MTVCAECRGTRRMLIPDGVGAYEVPCEACTVTRSLRCSSLPHLFACPGSRALPGPDVSQIVPAANDGSASHEGIASIVEGYQPDLDAIARRWSADRDEVGRLTWYARKAWEQLEPSFRGAEAEVPIQANVAGILLTGHVDLLAADRVAMRGRARLLDWKSGRLDVDHTAQIYGYACILILGYDIEEVIVSVVWLRDQEIETYTITRADALAWEEQLRVTLGQTDMFRTGRHCATCARSHACPAIAAIARRDIGMFTAGETDPVTFDLSKMAGSRKADLFRRAKVVAAFAESLREAIRADIAAHGPIDAGDGTELRLVTEPGPRQVDALRAWPVLQARLDDAEIAGAVKLSVSKLEEAVAAKAPARGGAAAKRDLKAALEAADAVSQGTVQKLKEVRKPKEIP